MRAGRSLAAVAAGSDTEYVDQQEDVTKMKGSDVMAQMGVQDGDENGIDALRKADVARHVQNPDRAARRYDDETAVDLSPCLRDE